MIFGLFKNEVPNGLSTQGTQLWILDRSLAWLAEVLAPVLVNLP